MSLARVSEIIHRYSASSSSGAKTSIKFASQPYRPWYTRESDHPRTRFSTRN